MSWDAVSGQGGRREGCVGRGQERQRAIQVAQSVEGVTRVDGRNLVGQALGPGPSRPPLACSGASTWPSGRGPRAAAQATPTGGLVCLEQ
jgi:hypothetical protein